MKHERLIKLTIRELFKTLGTNSSVGLSSFRAKQLLQQYGSNSFIIHDKYLWLKDLLPRFQNPLVLILLATSIISLFINDVKSLHLVSSGTFN